MVIGWTFPVVRFHTMHLQKANLHINKSMQTSSFLFYMSKFAKTKEGIQMNKNYEMDMCNGPLTKKIFLFTLPLIFSNVLQLLFNAADMIVVGKFAGDSALAAVGATTSLTQLLVNFFIGLSVGANVLIARYYAANLKEDTSKTVHTAIALSLVCGVILSIIGFFISRPMLILMGTPEEHNVLHLATLYLQVYFLGMPVIMLYNFGSAILRAIGDTKRPLYFLMVAGVINVLFNLFFVIVLDLSVVGVALGTIISQLISSICIIVCLVKNTGLCHLDLRKVRLHGTYLKKILFIGTPAGLQSVVFSISNVLIQSSVNSFGNVAITGNSAAASVEGFVYVAMNSFSHTALNFTSQNIGAKKYNRIPKILITCLFMVSFTGLALGITAYLGGNTLLAFYTDSKDAIVYGLIRMSVVCVYYFLCGTMDVFVGCIRGLGYSVIPMIVSIIGACGLRIVWIFTIFSKWHTLKILYFSYPFTWTVTILAHFVCFILVYRKTCAEAKIN